MHHFFCILISSTNFAVPVNVPSPARSIAVFLFRIISGKERFLCDEKCNCINVVVNFLRSAICFFCFSGCCSECFSVFTLYVLTGTF